MLPAGSKIEIIVTSGDIAMIYVDNEYIGDTDIQFGMSLSFRDWLENCLSRLYDPDEIQIDPNTWKV